MPYMKFVGDPKNENEGPLALEAYGHVWFKDQATEVSADLAEFLKGNDHFEPVKGRPKKVAVDDEDGA